MAEKIINPLQVSALLQQRINSLRQAIATNQGLPESTVTLGLGPVQSLSQVIQSVSQCVQSDQPSPRPTPVISQTIEDISQSVSEQVGEPQPSKEPEYQYKVRIINPNKKSDFKLRLIHNFVSKFKTVEELKELLMSQFESLVSSSSDFDVGYIEGSQQKIGVETEEDLRFMYRANKKGGNITLWCDGCFPSSTTGPGTKRKREVETATRRQDKEDEVEKIVMELSKKHPEIEKTKIRLWARMISGGLHDDYEKPPDIPAFHRPLKRPRKDNNLSDALCGAATAVCRALSPGPSSAGSSSSGSSGSSSSSGSSGSSSGSHMMPFSVSPTRAVNLRMKSYEQLRYLKQLFDDGIIRDKEYKEQKEHVMTTLRKL